MRSEHDSTSTRVAAGNLAGNLTWIAACFLIAASPLSAQAAQTVQTGATGVSVPQPVTSVDTPAKPSAAIPMPPDTTTQAQPASPAAYGPYVPYKAPGSVPAAPAYAEPSSQSSGFDPDAEIVTPENMHRRAPASSPARAADLNDPDANIVTSIPTHPGEVNDGTLIHARLRETLSTSATRPGSRFTAEISEPVMQEGRVYIPVGSVLEGRVSWVSGGKRIGGRAAIHLEPERVTLPDGTEYQLHARVIDTSSWQNTSVDREGTIIRKDNLKGTLEAGGLVTGAAVATGAVIAGPAGALVGAGIGAGATAIVWFKQDRQATLPKELGLTFSLTEPLSVEPAQAALPPAASTPDGE